MRAYLVVVVAVLGSSMLPSYGIAQDSQSSNTEGTETPTLQIKAKVAILDPQPIKGVLRESLKSIAQTTLDEFTNLGFETVSPAQVAEIYKNSKKRTPRCGDATQCLAEIGKKVESTYVVNIALKRAGKALTVKLTVVDTEDAEMVSNIVGLMAYSKDPALTEAFKQKLPRTTSVLIQHVNQKQATLAGMPSTPSSEEPATAGPLMPIDESKRDFEQTVRPTLQPESTPEVSPEELAMPEIPQNRSSSSIYSRKQILPWALVGGGALAVGIGVGVFGSQARSAVSDYQLGKDPEKARDRAKSKALWADITTGAGVALVATGVGVFLFTNRESTTPEPPRPIFSITPSGMGMAVSGSF